MAYGVENQSAFPEGVIEAGGPAEFDFDYSICTLVSNPALYRQMVESFRQKGFDADRCEFLFIDNTDQNRGDGYRGLNLLLNRARGRYVILCHQDIIAQDDRQQLDACLAAMTESHPEWAVAGNAGVDRERHRFFRLTDRFRLDYRSEGLPARVASLDENFLLVRAETCVRLSDDLNGFHLYGTDLCLQADLRGHSAWVIDYHVEHLAKGVYDASLITCIEAFEAKYRRVMAPHGQKTTVTHLGIGRRNLESALRKYRHRAVVGGRQTLAALRPLSDWLEHRPLEWHERRHGPVYELDGVSYRIPAGSPYAARKALIKGRYEAPERRAVREFLPLDCPVIELGGSFGIVSDIIRQTMGTDQPLVVVEAIPELATICRANIRDNGRPTTVISAALAYGAPKVSFQVMAGVHTSHLSSVPVSGETSDAAREIEIPATSLAALRQSQGIDGRFALVCDIEGAEFDLLANEADELADCDTIVMELHPPAYIDRGASVTAVRTMLDRAGFDVVDTDQTVIVARKRPSQ